MKCTDCNKQATSSVGWTNKQFYCTKHYHERLFRDAIPSMLPYIALFAGFAIVKEYVKKVWIKIIR